MATALIHGSLPPADRRGQIAHAAVGVARERIEEAHRASAAATRDLRNKLRLAYRVPYHEWERALATGPGAVTALLERYSAPHWPTRPNVAG